MGKRPLHRGSPDQIVQFGQRFVDGRLAGFNKDMEICLTPLKRAQGLPTHAYFPGLAACCGTLEYLTGLWRGDCTQSQGWQQVVEWAARFMAQPDYDRETVRVLVCVFRNPVAHRGIASGVWVDTDRDPRRHGRRMTWRVLADARYPGCEVFPEAGVLSRDPPWVCPYTHRVRIHLKRLWFDIRDGAGRYKEMLATDQQLQEAFIKCMEQLYPV